MNTQKRELFENRVYRHTSGLEEITKADVAPTVQGNTLTVHVRTSEPRGRANRSPLTVESTICVIDRELVMVIVEGWQYANSLGGLYAFVPSGDSWRRVSVSARVKARVRASTRQGAARVQQYLARSAAYDLARAERKAGMVSYVHPDTGTLERFDEADADALAGQLFKSQAKMVRALLAARAVRVTVEHSSENVVQFRRMA